MVYGILAPSLTIVTLRFRHNIGQIPDVYNIVRYHINDSYGFDLKVAKGYWKKFELRMEATAWTKWSVKRQHCDLSQTGFNLPNPKVGAHAYDLHSLMSSIPLYSI